MGRASRRRGYRQPGAVCGFRQPGKSPRLLARSTGTNLAFSSSREIFFFFLKRSNFHRYFYEAVWKVLAWFCFSQTSRKAAGSTEAACGWGQFARVGQVPCRVALQSGNELASSLDSSVLLTDLRSTRASAPHTWKGHGDPRKNPT